MGKKWFPQEFPDRILMPSGEVVEPDPLLPTAAAFLDERRSDGTTDPRELAGGLKISKTRAAEILDQLAALGHVGSHGVSDLGQRMVFDPDGPTDPTPLDVRE